MEVLGIAMLAGGVIGSGINGIKNSENVCKNDQSAIDILNQAANLQNKWENVLAGQTAIDQEIQTEITQMYRDLANLTASMKEAQAQTKKHKQTIITIGAIVITLMFFALLTKFFIKKYINKLPPNKNKTHGHDGKGKKI